MKNNYKLRNAKENTSKMLKSGFVALFLFLFISQTSNAQLVGWKYRDGITVKENAGAQKVNYQVLLNINTAALVTANKMNVKGNDIRFSKNCSGSVLLNYFIVVVSMK